MQKKVLSIIMAIGLLFTSAVSAQSYNKSIDFNTKTVTIKGTTTAAGEYVAVYVLKPGVTLAPSATPAVADIEYAGECISDANKDFSITMTFVGTGKYTAYISPANLTESISPMEIWLTDANGYNTIIAAINNDNDGNVFAADFVANDNNKTISMYDAIEDVLIPSNKADMYTLLDAGDLEDVTKSLDNTKKYYKALLATAANNDTLTVDGAEYLLRAIGEDELYTQYNDFVKACTPPSAGDTPEETFVAKLSGKGYTLATLEQGIADAIILATTKHATSIDTLKALYAKHSVFDTSVATNQAYTEVRGKDWADVATLEGKFDDYVQTVVVGGGSPSGSPSGGFTGGGVGTTIPTEIGMKFTDLNSVSWAYNAISELYTRNIVSGKTEYKFYPTDTIKREEFTTMMVKALNLPTGDRTTKFSDVDQSGWYAPFVSAAQKEGIISGISANAFGTGMEITKQDMAVIIYNSLKNKIEAGEPQFTDSGDIAGYARSAVAALANLGIISGTGDGSFAPTKTATRAEASVMIFKALNYLK